ncbi:MAG: hypothetical protein NWT08_13250 [Akkermansiaceae bacterium]|jgi:hypothetical protein|nr:hypothetical protein [Akkermansiaceae bacterium]MDP4647683.1 hypothetical protein [Akkermansiaceae bacterium]MDP4722257.1 hypothetical protein [Akkermansiaceae bacterium]MDP4780298.1 hypothetical protein [Akkermansiaceae bacterium]MDP4846219.1 hypothetical protein [Akkermansiaceae bacterium]
MSEIREFSPKRFAIASVTCPSCQIRIERDTKWCEACGFTGSKSMDMFGENPPPLLPILDVVDLWTPKEQKKIASAVKAFGKRFPQIKWRICAVMLGAEVSLPVFGFWLMNVCPLNTGETEEDREWTVLLLVDGKTGNTSVTTGYRAEVWLSDENWVPALAEASSAMRQGDTLQAVTNFLKTAKASFEKAWKRSQAQLKQEAAS